MADTPVRYPQPGRYSLLWLGLGLGATWLSAPT